MTERLGGRGGNEVRGTFQGQSQSLPMVGYGDVCGRGAVEREAAVTKGERPGGFRLVGSSSGTGFGMCAMGWDAYSSQGSAATPVSSPTLGLLPFCSQSPFFHPVSNTTSVHSSKN